ncbi:MAG: hypothetical protein ACLGIJ_13850 [Candidatus Limnocylindria bacterium]
MTRRLLVLALVLPVVVLTACGGTPPKPELTDPKAILVAAAEQAAAARGVHVNASADGSVVLDLFGTGGGGPVDLRGSTASVDLDLAGGDVRAIFAIGSVVRGELRAVDGTSYLRTTLTGAQYQRQEGAPVLTPGAVPDALQALVASLERPGVTPVREADVECGSGTCYRVTVDLDVDVLGDPAAGDLPLGGLADGEVSLAVLVSKATYDLASIDAVLTGPDGTDLTVALIFTKWGEAVSVEAPGPDEIAGGG